ncbi:hypothetical protein RUND412_008630 [Rhizina undulata]
MTNGNYNFCNIQIVEDSPYDVREQLLLNEVLDAIFPPGPGTDVEYFDGDIHANLPWPRLSVLEAFYHGTIGHASPSQNPEGPSPMPRPAGEAETVPYTDGLEHEMDRPDGEPSPLEQPTPTKSTARAEGKGKAPRSTIQKMSNSHEDWETEG